MDMSAIRSMHEKLLQCKSGDCVNSGANRKMVIHASVNVRVSPLKGSTVCRTLEILKRKKNTNKKNEDTNVFTQTKGNVHVICRKLLHYLNMNESIFDVDQLCCPVSQCLLYRFIK